MMPSFDTFWPPKYTCLYFVFFFLFFISNMNRGGHSFIDMSFLKHIHVDAIWVEGLEACQSGNVKIENEILFEI